MSDIIMLYSTFRNRDEALSVAQALLDKKLIACANLHADMTSLYRWAGKMQQETESSMWMKTTKDKVQAAMALIKEMHSYEVPCIVQLPVETGNPAFLEWVEKEVAG